MSDAARPAGALRVALVGLGKIARDQHVPALADNPQFALAATVDPAAPSLDGLAHFASLDALLDSGCAFDAAAVCTPPQVRSDIALRLVSAGRHVLLEKPPGATAEEIGRLAERATASGATLFTAWHSRYAAGVAPARAWLAGRRIERVQIVWREDVHVWHPGQHWIWRAGGFGVFDPGINALSIVSAILPRPLSVTRSALQVPANCAAPVAARVQLCDTQGLEVEVDLDFRQQGPQTWTIAVETDAGLLELSQGGRVLRTPDGVTTGEDEEYPALYDHFARLVREGHSHVDTAPLRLAAEALRLGAIERVEALTV